MNKNTLRVGIGGPVGTGKTALLERLCKHMRSEFNIAAITNDIYTREDAEFLTRSCALSADRILGVETGGCPHTAIREDASMNLAAISDLDKTFEDFIQEFSDIKISDDISDSILINHYLYKYRYKFIRIMF